MRQAAARCSPICCRRHLQAPAAGPAFDEAWADVMLDLVLASCTGTRQQISLQATLPMAELTQALASPLACIALGHVEHEYPNKLDHVMEGPQDVRGPRALHPIFYGSFDWHSCVHSYWMLVRLRRRFPALPEAPAVGALFDRNLTAANVATEAAYVARHPGFERPYGWAWLLMLAAELGRDTGEAGRGWFACLAPLAEVFASRFRTFLPKAHIRCVWTRISTAPSRSGWCWIMPKVVAIQP